ncbi:MAG: ribonuclease P protein component [Candidatus Paceibacteria bacterium]
MIPERFRLKKERNFDILFDKGQFESGSVVDVKYWSIDLYQHPDRFKEDDLKIGFVVSTDISNKATVRNRKKRQIREATKELLDEFELNKGFLVAIMAKKSILESDFNKIKQELKSILTKIGVIE